MIELAILGLLREQDQHGYELRKRIGALAGSRGTSFGSLYPALTRLERAGAVKAVEASTSARPVPLTGSLSGEASVLRALLQHTERGPRGKKSYGITELGERLLQDLLDDPASDDKAFRLKVAFCRHLPDHRRLALFERRRNALAEQLHEQSRSSRRRGAGERIDTYLRSLHEHDRESVERDIVWLDRLIAAERDGTTAGSAGTTTGVDQ